MPASRQSDARAHPYFRGQAFGEWMRAPEHPVPRTTPQVAARSFWSRLFRIPLVGGPGTNKPDEGMAASRRTPLPSPATVAGSGPARRSLRAKPKPPTTTCPTPQNRPARTAAATSAVAARAAAKTAETTRTTRAVRGILAASAMPVAKEIRAAKEVNPAREAANHNAVRCPSQLR